MEDWKIRQLEEEIRHEREMRSLLVQRVDTHHEWLEGMKTLLDTIGTRLETLTASQERTEAMLQNFIQTLAREHSEG